MPLAGRRPFQAGIVASLTLLLWASAPVVNLYGTSRPEPIEPAAGAARWPAPEPVVDHVSTPELHRSSGLPLRVAGERPHLEFHVEREVIELFGPEPFETAAETWSAVRGAAVTISIAGIVDDQVERNLYDGINRIFINRRSCVAPTLGRAHIDAGEVDERFGTAVSQVREVNIGLCSGIRLEQVAPVVLHEMGHALGFGHLCDRGDHHGCWRPEMGDDSHRCRVMYAAATACQEWDERDEMAAIRNYPVVPRIAGPDPARTGARLAHSLIERAWEHETVLVLDPDVGDELRWATAATAGALRAPLLLAPDVAADCASGEFGRELARIAAHGAEVVLVGPAAMRCGPRIEQWELGATIVRRATDLTGLTLGRIAAPRGVIVAGVDHDGRVPLGGPAAALAGQLGWPLLFAPGGGLSAEDVERLGELPRVRVAHTMGGTDLPVGRVDAQLRWHHDIEVASLDATSAEAASARLAEDGAFAGHDDVLVARRDGIDGVLIAAYAPLVSSLPVFVEERLGPSLAQLLTDREGGGLIVGHGITTSEAVLINRWVDGGSG